MAKWLLGRRRKRFQPGLDALESRLALYGAQPALHDFSLPLPTCGCGCNCGGACALPLPVFSMPLPPGTQPPAGAPLPPVENTPFVPSWHSNPAAAVKLYLDFNGHQEESWGAFTNVAIPPYDSDGNPAGFSVSDLVAMDEIWRRVAEDYAPFNVDVTTEDPGGAGNVLRVAIGGNGSWTGGTNGGIAYIDAFSSAIPNVVFVFPDHLSQGHARLVAESVSHEAGHGFGLAHQSVYDAEGNKTEEYNPGNSSIAPIMGDAYVATRSLWWVGPSADSAELIQDDMEVLAATIGWRPDDVGGTPGTATPLAVNNTLVFGAGIIGTMDDLDSWSFATDSGTVMFSAQVRTGINNLDLKLQLLDAFGNVIVPWQDPGDTFDATVFAEVAAGYYTIVVGTHGGYGDVGQYTLSGVIMAPASSMPPPSGLYAYAPAYDHVFLSWQDSTDEESGYLIERSTDGTDWIGVVQLPANSVAYTDGDVEAAHDYLYRVAAVSGSELSAYSLPASVSTPPSLLNAPTNLEVTGITIQQVDLNWNDLAIDETGYVIERSNDGTSWTGLAELPADSVTYADAAVQPAQWYLYRIAARRGGEISDYSNVAFAFVPLATPAAPTNLQATAVGVNRIDLTWHDNANDETSYVLERSLEGVNWEIVLVLPHDSTSYSDLGVADDTVYYYRVRAYSEGGGQSVSSDYSNVATAVSWTAPPAAPTGLQAKPVGANLIHLAWQDNADNETGYVVERTEDGTTWTIVATLPPNQVSYDDGGVDASHAYLYRVEAADAAAGRVFSNSTLVQTPSAPPKAPTGLKGILQGRKFVLSWLDNASNETSFKILRSTDGRNWTAVASTGANAKAIRVARPPRTKTFYYQVVAVNAGGDSAATGVLTVKVNTVVARSLGISQFLAALKKSRR